MLHFELIRLLLFSYDYIFVSVIKLIFVYLLLLIKWL